MKDENEMIDLLSKINGKLTFFVVIVIVGGLFSFINGCMMAGY